VIQGDDNEDMSELLRRNARPVTTAQPCLRSGGRLGTVASMPTPDRNAALHLLAELADRPLGDVELASGRALAPISRGMWVGAENLLVKAVRALKSDDLDRAAALVERATSLPFDEHEESAPAALAAHMILYSLVTDVLERSDEGDYRWLDVAIEVLDSSDEFARQDLRDVLAAVDQDYELSAAAHRRLGAAIRTVAPSPELRDMTDLGRAELAHRIMAILRTTIRFEEAMVATTSEGR
jgi:hypothetical protein